MSKKEYKALKNLIHNTEGVTKKDILEAVKESVKDMFPNIMQEYFKTQPFMRMISSECYSDKFLINPKKVEMKDDSNTKQFFIFKLPENGIGMPSPLDLVGNITLTNAACALISKGKYVISPYTRITKNHEEDERIVVNETEILGFTLLNKGDKWVTYDR